MTQSEKDNKPNKSLLDMIKAYDNEMDAKNRRTQEEIDTLATEILDGLEKLKDDLKPNDK